MLGGTFALNDDLDKAVIAVAGAADDNAGLVVGNVFETVVTGDITPSGLNLLSGLVVNVLGPGSGFAVAKVVNRIHCEGGGEKVGEGMNLGGNIQTLHIPFGDARQKFETAKLGVGDGGAQMFGEFAGLNHGAKDSWNVINLDAVGQSVFVQEREGNTINSCENVSVFVFDVTKGGAVGPFFGFAVAGGDIGQDDAGLIHGGVDGLDDGATGLEVGKVADGDGADIGGGEKGTRAHYLAIHGEGVVAVVDDGDVHSFKLQLIIFNLQVMWNRLF